MLEPPSFTGISETLLITLAARGLARRRAPDLGFADPEAERLAALFDGRLERYAADSAGLRAIILREQWFDSVVLDFAGQHPAGLVVDLGCGLNTGQARLAERLPPGLRWLNLDLPPVVAARRRLLIEPPGAEAMAADLAKAGWQAEIAVRGGPFLFLAQGLLLYLEPPAVARLLRGLAAECPGARLAFDYSSPLMARLSRRLPVLRPTALSRQPGPPFRWSLGRATDLRALLPGLMVLQEYDPTPRIGLLPGLLAGLHWRLTGGRAFYGLAEVRFPERAA